jgi:uncharacterized protein YndB with AHSA1/START domain
VVPYQKLVWTSALSSDYRPQAAAVEPSTGSFAFTAMISMKPHETGAKYTALVMHGDAAGCKAHQEMGFYEGWGKALDQLVAYVQTV